MVRKRTRHHGAGRDGRDPFGRNTDEVDARGESAIPFGPRVARSRRVQVSKDINYRTRIEKATQGRSTFPRCVRRIGAPPIKSPVKDRVEIPTQQGGNGKVNFDLQVAQKGVPGRIAVRDVQGTHAKRLAPKRKLALEVPPLRITPGIRNRQRITKKNNAPGGTHRAWGTHNSETRRLKPRRALPHRRTVDLLEADDIRPHRKGTDPL